MWGVPCQIALPCATQNELNLEDAKILAANGCTLVAEGANMPLTAQATDYLRRRNILHCPGKAANAGGVAVSALEMTQNAMGQKWSFSKVDGMLEGIMTGIFQRIDTAAKTWDMADDYVAGANLAGFETLSRAILNQGVV